MESVSSDQVDLFHNCSRILIGGFSGSGKSYLTAKLINHYQHKFERIVVIGSDLGTIQNEKIVRDDNFNIEQFENINNNHWLLVYDDVIHNKTQLRQAMISFFMGRHKKISCIFLTQNIFLNSNDFRTIALNSTHIILLRMRDNRQITHFSSSFLPREKRENFLKLYKLIVLKKKFQYLLIDFLQDPDSSLLIRTNLFDEGLQTCIQI